MTHESVKWPRGFEQLVLHLHIAALQRIALYDKLNPCFVAKHAFGHYVFEDLRPSEQKHRRALYPRAPPLRSSRVK